MLQRLFQYKVLIAVFLLVAIAVAGSGFWFANQKSEPVYLSKIDKLMFDTENRAPKFVLTLSDAEQKPKDIPAEATVTSEVILPKTEETNEPKTETMEEILNHIPTLGELQAKEPSQALDFIVINQDMTENKDQLVLPKISEKGSKPWSEYGNSVEVQPNFKKVAIVFKNLGFDPFALDKIIKGFASEVSFSFTPYATDSGTKILSARQFGHETYVDMLLSSHDFLKSDSGPLSMSLTISKEEALSRLRKSLSTGAPIGGVIVNDGVADEDNREIITALLIEIKSRGLLMIDATHGDGINNIKIDGLAHRKADVVIDEDFNRKSIHKAIQKAENIAFTKGQVLLVAEPKPVVILAIHEWIKTFSPQVSYEEARGMEIDKPLALVPLSNLVVE